MRPRRRTRTLAQGSAYWCLARVCGMRACKEAMTVCNSGHVVACLCRVPSSGAPCQLGRRCQGLQIGEQGRTVHHIEQQPLICVWELLDLQIFAVAQIEPRGAHLHAQAGHLVVDLHVDRLLWLDADDQLVVVVAAFLGGKHVPRHVLELQMRATDDVRAEMSDTAGKLHVAELDQAACTLCMPCTRRTQSDRALARSTTRAQGKERR